MPDDPICSLSSGRGDRLQFVARCHADLPAGAATDLRQRSKSAMVLPTRSAHQCFLLCLQWLWSKEKALRGAKSQIPDYVSAALADGKCCEAGDEAACAQKMVDLEALGNQLSGRSDAKAPATPQPLLVEGQADENRTGRLATPTPRPAATPGQSSQSGGQRAGGAAQKAATARAGEIIPWSWLVPGMPNEESASRALALTRPPFCRLLVGSLDTSLAEVIDTASLWSALAVAYQAVKGDRMGIHSQSKHTKWEEQNRKVQAQWLQQKVEADETFPPRSSGAAPSLCNLIRLVSPLDPRQYCSPASFQLAAFSLYKVSGCWKAHSPPVCWR